LTLPATEAGRTLHTLTRLAVNPLRSPVTSAVRLHGSRMTTLVPMQQDAFDEYLAAAVAGYADDNVTSGLWPAEGALARSRADLEASLPRGLATPGHFLFEIRSELKGPTVGFIWFAVIEKDGIRSAFVYDVEVKAGFRRRGHARAAFKAIEPLVRELGLSSIGLHVFGHNPGAQALYRSLGYGVTGMNMLKVLGKDGV
jgi:ribosomal protein S18 acetylase RimI-like enzyme